LASFVLNYLVTLYFVVGLSLTKGVPILDLTAMNEQLRELLIAPRFLPFQVRLDDGSGYEVPSKEHAWFGTGRSGLLFIENDSGAASVIQIRKGAAADTGSGRKTSSEEQHQR
jgi:hypothetical protein